ncbi:MAG: pseudouridine synthase [Gammaproteobacteria bacterium]|nr:pseudouridine synthase [Gammaproteobacteria bacterium]
MPLILLNKPFRVLSQFSDSENRTTLAGFVANPAVYPAGRLDFDSEGLVILTDDGRLQARISEPRFKLDKYYWVQVEGEASAREIDALLAGVRLKDGLARATAAELIPEPAILWPRTPPIRERKHIPASWLNLCIIEGRNRQVRRMTAAVGLPALRLIRHRVGPWTLEGLEPGATREIETASAWQALNAYRSPPLD